MKQARAAISRSRTLALLTASGSGSARSRSPRYQPALATSQRSERSTAVTRAAGRAGRASPSAYASPPTRPRPRSGPGGTLRSESEAVGIRPTRRWFRYSSSACSGWPPRRPAKEEPTRPSCVSPSSQASTADGSARTTRRRASRCRSTRDSPARSSHTAASAGAASADQVSERGAAVSGRSARRRASPGALASSRVRWAFAMAARSTPGTPRVQPSSASSSPSIVLQELLDAVRRRRDVADVERVEQ